MASENSAHDSVHPDYWEDGTCKLQFSPVIERHKL